MRKISEDEFDRFHLEEKELQRLLQQNQQTDNKLLDFEESNKSLLAENSDNTHLGGRYTHLCLGHLHINWIVPELSQTKSVQDIKPHARSADQGREEEITNLSPDPSRENCKPILSTSTLMVRNFSHETNSFPVSLPLLPTFALPTSTRNNLAHCLVGVSVARYKKCSKSSHKAKQTLLNNNNLKCEARKLNSSSIPKARDIDHTRLLQSVALQSAIPTTINLPKGKQGINVLEQRDHDAYRCRHKTQLHHACQRSCCSHQDQLPSYYQPLANVRFPSIPLKLQEVLTAQKLQEKRRQQQKQPSCACWQYSTDYPTTAARKRLKRLDCCGCSGSSKSDSPGASVGAARVARGAAASKGAAATAPTAFRHNNLTNLFLIIVMLINLAPIVCGHNVNVNNSDKTASPKQQHMQQQYHHHHQHESNVNNIRREMGTRFASLNNGFTNADGSDVGDGDGLGESSRGFVGEDILTVNTATSSDRTDKDASSAPFVRSGCHSCQMREKVKADNLASIKRHILYRLKLKDVPNITAPVVPPEIVEKFYKSHYQHNGVNGDRTRGGGHLGASGNGAGGADTRTPYSDENVGGGSGGRYSSTIYDNMQGDDPRAFYDANYDGGDTSDGGFGKDFGDSAGGDDDDYEEDFFSVVNSIYVFPTTQHTRHNRKTDILHFALSNNGYSTVSQATLHIFLRSWSYVREHYESTLSVPISTGPSSMSPNGGLSQQGGPNSMPLNLANRNLDVILKVNCVLRHQNTTHAQKSNEIRQRIPRSDNGVWVTLDVTEMVTEWYNNASTNHGVVIKTKEPWMKQFVVLDDLTTNKTYAPYIEVMTKDNRKRRSKRNTSLNCSETDNEVRCCRYPLEVNFRHFNWEWIIAPQSFNAYFCNGECKLGFLPKYPHTHLMQMSTAPQPCCSPTKMSPVSLLYFNHEHILVMSTIPNMAVDRCSCS